MSRWCSHSSGVRSSIHVIGQASVLRYTNIYNNCEDRGQANHENISAAITIASISLFWNRPVAADSQRLHLYPYTTIPNAIFPRYTITYLLPATFVLHCNSISLKESADHFAIEVSVRMGGDRFKLAFHIAMCPGADRYAGSRRWVYMIVAPMNFHSCTGKAQPYPQRKIRTQAGLVYLNRRPRRGNPNLLPSTIQSTKMRCNAFTIVGFVLWQLKRARGASYNVQVSHSSLNAKGRRC